MIEEMIYDLKEKKEKTKAYEYIEESESSTFEMIIETITYWLSYARVNIVSYKFKEKHKLSHKFKFYQILPKLRGIQSLNFTFFFSILWINILVYAF